MPANTPPLPQRMDTGLAAGLLLAVLLAPAFIPVPCTLLLHQIVTMTNLSIFS